jgi:hypothetical protein
MLPKQVRYPVIIAVECRILFREPISPSSNVPKQQDGDTASAESRKHRSLQQLRFEPGGIAHGTE